MTEPPMPVTAEWLTVALRAGGGWLPARERAIGDAALAGLPAVWERLNWPRFARRQGLSVVHGDCYFSNSLVPRAGQTGSAVWIDFQSPSTGLAAFDAAREQARRWCAHDYMCEPVATIHNITVQRLLFLLQMCYHSQ